MREVELGHPLPLRSFPPPPSREPALALMLPASLVSLDRPPNLPQARTTPSNSPIVICLDRAPGKTGLIRRHFPPTEHGTSPHKDATSHESRNFRTDVSSIPPQNNDSGLKMVR
jgi:hypothetical protein